MKTVLVAGTFEYLHIGHVRLLEKAFSIGDFVRVGIASDEYSIMYKPNTVFPYEDRKNKVYSWCKSLNKNFEIFSFDTPFGDAADNPSYTDIVVTNDTIKTAQDINATRNNPLSIHNVPLVKDELNLEPISSTRIRQGYIDTDGTVFYHPSTVSDITISSPQRKALKSITWGTISEVPESIPSITVVVGDASCHALSALSPSMFIYDNVLERNALDEKDRFNPPASHPITTLQNPPGTITVQLQETIFSHTSSNSAIEVEGEEDLATIAALLILPLGAKIYYGMPSTGLMELPVTLEWKRNAYYILYGNDRN